MEYQEYIKPELLVLVPVMYFIGIGVKKSSVSDKWIPIILGTVSIILSLIWVIAVTEISGVKSIIMAIFTAITQGILIAGVSVYTNQVYLQVKKDE